MTTVAVASFQRTGVALRGSTFLIASVVVHIALFVVIQRSWAASQRTPKHTETIEITLTETTPIPPAPLAPSAPAEQRAPPQRTKAVAKRALPPVVAPPIQPIQPLPDKVAVIAVPAAAPAEDGEADAGAPGVASNSASSGAPGGVGGDSAAQPVTGPGYDAAYLHNPPPHYPAIARKLKLQGTTTIRVLVSPEGHPQRVAIAKSSGVELLDEAAMEAVRQWSFVPARQGSKAIAAEVDVPMRFRLTGAGVDLPD